MIFFLVKPRMTVMGAKQILANQQRFKAASEALFGIKEIKLYAREKFYLEQFSKPTYDMARFISYNQILSQIPRFLVEASAFGGIILLAIFLMINSGGIESDNLGNIIPLLGLYAFAGLKLLPAIQVIYHSSTQIQFWNSAIDNLIKDFVSSDGIDNQTYDAPISMKINKFERLELTNIFYAYPSTNQY